MYREEALGTQEDHDARVLIRRMRQDVHQVLAPKGPFADAHRREAVPVLVEGLRLEIRPLRRADAPLSQAHRRPAVPVPDVRAGLLPVRPFGPSHEAPLDGLI